MGRLLSTSLLAGVLAVAGTAAAQDFIGGRGNIGGSGSWSGGIDNDISLGQVQGTIASMDRSRGLLRIRAGGRLVTVHAKPTQMVDMRPGASILLEYQDYNGTRWLTDASISDGGSYSGGGGFIGGGSFGDLDFSSSGSRQFSEMVQTSGELLKLDTEQGTMTLSTSEGTTTVRAHPEEMRDLLPGQFLSLTYARVGNTNWLDDLDDSGYFGGGGIIGGGSGGFIGGSGY